MAVLKPGYLKFDGLKHILDGYAVVTGVTGPQGPQGITGSMGPDGNYSGTYYVTTPTLTGNYSANTKDYFIAAVPGNTITLPTDPPIGYEVIVKDINGGSTPSTYITINASGPVYFDYSDFSYRYITASFGYYRFLCTKNKFGEKSYVTLDTKLF